VLTICPPAPLDRAKQPSCWPSPAPSEPPTPSRP
jgi:hypothetical protein